jgi:uncharacterized LabA/DUF88 family protein
MNIEMHMSSEKSPGEVVEAPVTAAKKRAYALIDGFNLYHALDKFQGGTTEEEQAKFQRYKWLCLKSLMGRLIDPEAEVLEKVIFFTSYPYWNEEKRRNHQTYVTALKYTGVEYVLGEFKENWIPCRATCKETFDKPVEKQTDVNIAISMIELAEEFDVLYLITADSDQVPAIRLLKKLHRNKTVYVVAPIGRNSNELARAAGGKLNRKIMKEDDLRDSQLPNPFEKEVDGKKIFLVRPANWPDPA